MQAGRHRTVRPFAPDVGACAAALSAAVAEAIGFCFALASSSAVGDERSLTVREVTP
jgi:hypothetical protein